VTDEEVARVMALVDPWLVLLAKRHRPYEEEMEDACQWARLWALQALPAYDPTKGSICNFLETRVRYGFRDRAGYLRAKKRACTSLPLFDAERVAAPRFEEGAIVRAMLASALRARPPAPRAKEAITLLLSGKNLAEESRRLGLCRDGLGMCLRHWVKQARRACVVGSVDTHLEEP